MKTLADLKRELCVGSKVILKKRFGEDVNEAREVIRTQSNSLVFKTPTGKNSHLDYPKAALLEFDGNVIRIFQAGERELTPEEKAIIEGEPKDDEQQRIDLLSDGSVMFHRRKRYYLEKDAEYLQGHNKQKGMRFCYNSGKIVDDNVKGDITLEYEIAG